MDIKCAYCKHRRESWNNGYKAAKEEEEGDNLKLAKCKCGNVVNADNAYKQGLIDAFELISNHFELSKENMFFKPEVIDIIDELYNKAEKGET